MKKWEGTKYTGTPVLLSHRKVKLRFAAVNLFQAAGHAHGQSRIDRWHQDRAAWQPIILVETTGTIANFFNLLYTHAETGLLKTFIKWSPLRQELEAPFNNATSRGLRREPPAGAGGLQVAGFKAEFDAGA
ncbi:MAG TPA: hypothetical protein VK654_03005 [Nitrospirota bacterium]|nr:hypothetical protein [Nitrospirota bacterium]